MSSLDAADDWPAAEALAVRYLKAERHAVDPISLRRYEATPYLLAAWWTGGDAHVLVYGGEVHPERGVAALARFLAVLGPSRLRGLDVEWLDGMLQALGTSQPVAPGVGGVVRSVDHDQDLFPAIVDQDGVITYVVHCYEVFMPLPPIPTSDPPPPSGGSRPYTGMMGLQRWSLQLYPVPPELDWKREGRFERPEPPRAIP